MILSEYVFTRGRASLAHLRLPGSPRTICGYAWSRSGPATTGRRVCPRCLAFLA